MVYAAMKSTVVVRQSFFATQGHWGQGMGDKKGGGLTCCGGSVHPHRCCRHGGPYCRRSPRQQVWYPHKAVLMELDEQRAEEVIQIGIRFRHVFCKLKALLLGLCMKSKSTRFRKRMREQKASGSSNYSALWTSTKIAAEER